MLHFIQKRGNQSALCGGWGQSEEHGMWDLIQPEVRNEGEMRLWRAQVLKHQFTPQDFYVYPEGSDNSFLRKPLTIHEE